ncbi:ATP-binding protein [Streptomyces alkaliterrae]|uniref:ATP-binding protein n=1 Tax=Streptomyces alkaliterrae TaxID=2213162 RepID=A0A5P0YQK0_9ACTN|nr:ATP-binding protein [Streptomyces alkaliterrae]MBB1257530.1 ATP-binding protein [Streptomyces alkaliterrae]MQS02581.1 ATP-binding protein [Streptomyces alkaliterrae]
MDPTHRGPQGREGRDSGALARTVQLVAADYLVTVNPVDGSEIEICPPTSLPEPPKRRGTEAREARQRAAEPVPPAGEAALELPLLERKEERKRLVALLAQGRSVRLVGRPGSGRTALLNAVAADCAELAPDGVLRLSGHRRTPTDLLHEMFAAVHDAPYHRLGRAELLEAVARIGAVVVLDDAQFGGSALEELLLATPECAFLISATPDAAPPADQPADQTALVEVPLEGLSRTACMELLALAARRPLSEEETEWAADLWFESEGLPLRFLQAGALLRHRDRLRAPSGTTSQAAGPDGSGPDDTAPGGSDPADAVPSRARSADPFSGDGRTGQDTRPADTALHSLPDDRAGEAPSSDDSAASDESAAFDRTDADTGTDAGSDADTDGGADTDAAAPALPPLSVSISPAQVAATLSPLALETLRFALALGGELPHQAHLPALVDDPRADTGLAELAAAGLATATGACYRLSGGVAGQLVAARTIGDRTGELPDFTDERENADRALRAAQHYAWWAGHPSVTAERVAGESGAVLSAIQGAKKAGHPSTAALLAHTASPVFAASLLWSAWESALRGGQEAARLAGEVAEEAYFHHELGVLALCLGNVERARAELEASIGLRGALADKRGAVAGRRALALVEDRAVQSTSAALPPEPQLPGAAVRPETPAAGTRRVTALQGSPPPGGPVAQSSAADASAERRRRWPVVGTARRNMAAAGAGVLLAVVLGTVMTLGNTSGKDAPTGDVRPSTSTSSDEQPFPSNVVEREKNSQAPTPVEPGRPVAPAETTPSPSPSGTEQGGTEQPTSEPDTPTVEPSEPTGRPTDPGEPTRTPTTPPTESEKPTPTPTPTPTETDDPEPDPEPSASFTSSSPPTTPTASASATEGTFVAA